MDDKVVSTVQASDEDALVAVLSEISDESVYMFGFAEVVKGQKLPSGRWILTQVMRKSRVSVQSKGASRLEFTPPAQSSTNIRQVASVMSTSM